MNGFRQKKRAWLWIATAAIVLALIALLVPHGTGNAQPELLALLPVFFVGLIAPHVLTPVSPALCPENAPDAPALAPLFQRPPPTRL